MAVIGDFYGGVPGMVTSAKTRASVRAQSNA
jgi:hypothetical protein